MDATLYTGTGSGGLVVNNADTGTQGFYPDLIWIKSRNAAYYHTLLDYQRGASVRLFSNLNDAESNNGCQSSFNTNGFTLNADSGGVNNSGTTYVAWQWNAGSGTNSSNTAGTITSYVDVNTTAGFSIVTFTGNGSASQTVGHGLGTTPQFIIEKRRNSGQNWYVYFPQVGSNGYYFEGLNNTNAGLTNSASQIAFSSTTGTLNGVGDHNTNGGNYLWYCWFPVAGFSSFGSYTGNGSADGPFIYTGFRPRWLMTKRADSSSSGDWNLVDTSRGTYNAVGPYFYANSSASEGNVAIYDILSNGFKIRESGAGTNANGSLYVYAAFAENPFKYANAR
jgi:hypothetical protein